MQIVTSWMKQGIRQGRKEGRQEATRQLVVRLLTRRFGKLSTSASRKINALPICDLEQLGEDLLGFETAADLTDWLTSR